jgi:hypothetical protein
MPLDNSLMDWFVGFNPEATSGGTPMTQGNQKQPWRLFPLAFEGTGGIRRPCARFKTILSMESSLSLPSGEESSLDSSFEPVQDPLVEEERVAGESRGITEQGGVKVGAWLSRALFFGLSRLRWGLCVEGDSVVPPEGVE